jgi:hypothetical protein
MENLKQRDVDASTDVSMDRSVMYMCMLPSTDGSFDQSISILDSIAYLHAAIYLHTHTHTLEHTRTHAHIYLRIDR